MSSKPRVSSKGSIIWQTSDGIWHREDNKPAAIGADGTLQFWKGDRHIRTIKVSEVHS